MPSLNEFLNSRLRSQDAKTSQESPPWWEDGVTVEVDQQTYYRYLDMLPPRFMNGDLFAFGEGAGNFVLFWQESKRYFAQQLSLSDTETFCSLSRVPLHQ